MKHLTKEIVIHFLKEHVSMLEKKSAPSICSFLKEFLVHHELIPIIKSTTDRAQWANMDLEKLPTEKLWDLIEHDHVVLTYYLEQWNVDTRRQEALAHKTVIDTLHQLSAQSHYLGDKPMKEWDEYDYANYKSLSLKSGRIKCLYGIYFRYISQEEVMKCTSHPKRLFDSWGEANTYLQRKIKHGEVKEQEVHILNICKSV